MPTLLTMYPNELIPFLLTIAWLAPLAGTIVTWIAGRIAIGVGNRLPGWIAVAAMGVSFGLVTLAALGWWLFPSGTAFAPGGWTFYTPYSSVTSIPGPVSGSYYTLGEFGDLALGCGYYIDGLTMVMFGVITLISLAVHVYSLAYMQEGLPDDDIEDAVEAEGHDLTEEEALHDAQPTTYKPQLTRFFTLLQFFTFAMLGLVLAGNLLQLFMFWELVGIASYLLIGFHFERPHAASAGTKAFVMNRIGDAGFLIGMMILLVVFGTLTFDTGIQSSDISYPGESQTNLGGLLRLAGFVLPTSDTGGMLLTLKTDGSLSEIPRWWLIVAGLGLFAGCVGKSAQLPLSTWLPDAMAGPTPVSALVHSATMVAAGVYLIGRLHVLFLPEVLIVIAYVGVITLVYGAICALAQTDLKRILAYSTISQLGYMMLALGVGGREAGLFHLVTHAFFKSLLFLAAGSVIVACHHVQDLSQMGGLRKKLPLTASTSLVGVIAISGLAVPFFQPFGASIAFSGYHSKDSILAAALEFTWDHPAHFLLYWLPLLTAGLTAFYMFRFWLVTFVGRPRDRYLYEHAKEPSLLMGVPMVILAIYAASIAFGGEQGALFHSLIEPRLGAALRELPSDGYDPAHAVASIWGLMVALAGTVAACVYYGLRDVKIKPAELSTSWRGPVALGCKVNELHDWLVVTPVWKLARLAAWCDRVLLDGLLRGMSRAVLVVAQFDRFIDDRLVDGLVNRLAAMTYTAGLGLRTLQTGRLRQYIVALAVATIALFALAIVIIPRMF